MAQESHVQPESPAADLAIVAAMVEELEEYIVKEDLFRTLFARVPGSGDVKLQMTGGELLTRLHRLNAQRAQLAPEQQRRVEELTEQAQRIIYSLKTRFHQRLQREMKGRLDSLKWFLDEAADDPARGRANYPFEIRNRQRVEEILKELKGDVPDDLAMQLATQDRRLRALGGGGAFVWDPSLRGVYPSPPYWYLYTHA